ncbi:hypothetical protein ONZ51_g4084 [Trametes cubensis]|uniref:Mid2 domain-containing protein n=1 Tax=Trametes cubensis TaxID=1111947 RepID=A0AAD7XF17_9APHY|nr:hypothetical protein ONZ51_g4084 [Trametes cubensis]
MLPCRKVALAFLATLSFALVVPAILVNHTVDDQAVLNPMVLTYTGPAGNSWIPGQTCTTCLIPPGIIDPSKAYDGTWFYTGEASTSIVASFTGTAVYVYNILPNTVPSNAPTLTNLSFSIDGDYAGQFVHIPDSTSTVLYNVSIFASTNLANAAHVLTISVQGENASHVLFDYLVYTTDEAEPQTSSTPPTSTASPLLPDGSTPTSASPHTSPNTSSTPIGAIVGGVIGGTAILLLAALLLLLYRSKRSRIGRSSRETPPTSRGAYLEFGPVPEHPDHMQERESPPSRHLRPHQGSRVQSSVTAVGSPNTAVGSPNTAVGSPNTSSIGVSGTGSSNHSRLQSDANVQVIREQIVEIREEFERMARAHVAERMMHMLPSEQPPSYEEPRHAVRKRDRLR